MKRKILLMAALAGILSLAANSVLADDQAPVQEKARAQKHERIYGAQLMTREERIEYRAKMRAAKTAEEREQIREEHHELMKGRAKERGVTLPDEPPPGGGGMGPGGGRDR